ncbi:MAG: hypothetical protein ACK5Z0_07375, partial [Planctomycetota bacterium]
EKPLWRERDLCNCSPARQTPAARKPQIRTYPNYLFIDCYSGIPPYPSNQLAHFAKPLRSDPQVYQNCPI